MRSVRVVGVHCASPCSGHQYRHDCVLVDTRIVLHRGERVLLGEYGPRFLLHHPACVVS